MKDPIENRPAQDQVRFVNFLLKRLGLKNDAALSRRLRLAPPLISKWRHNRLNVSGDVLVQIFLVTGIAIDDLLSVLYGTRKADLRELLFPTPKAKEAEAA